MEQQNEVKTTETSTTRIRIAYFLEGEALEQFEGERIVPNHIFPRGALTAILVGEALKARLQNGGE